MLRSGRLPYDNPKPRANTSYEKVPRQFVPRHREVPNLNYPSVAQAIYNNVAGVGGACMA